LSHGDSESYTVYVNARNSNEINSYSNISYACPNSSKTITGSLNFVDQSNHNIDKIITETVCTDFVNGIEVYKDTDRKITLYYDDELLNFYNGNGVLDANPILQVAGNDYYYYTTNEEYTLESNCPSNATNIGHCEAFVNGKTAFFLASYAHDYFNEKFEGCNNLSNPLSFQEISILLRVTNPGGSLFSPTGTMALIKNHFNKDVVFHEYTHYINGKVLSPWGYDIKTTPKWAQLRSVQKILDSKILIINLL